MTGVLYGIGVGPGDPELLTLKAVRKIQACDVIAVPGKDYRESIAYGIAIRAVPEIQEKECMGIVMPMTRDRKVLRECHERAAGQLAGLLDQGKQVGFLNLGDVTIYASYLYIHRRVAAMGYKTELINGVPSFCAAAARMGIGLVENSDQLHILSQPEQIEEGLKLSGTKVIMKMGKNMGQARSCLEKSGQDVGMVENCGMPGERVCRNVGEIYENAGYYSLIIVKDKPGNGQKDNLMEGKRDKPMEGQEDKPVERQEDEP